MASLEARGCVPAFEMRDGTRPILTAACPICRERSALRLTVGLDDQSFELGQLCACEPHQVFGALGVDPEELIPALKGSPLVGEKTLPFRKLSDLLDEVPEQPQWAWEGFVARGAVTLLGGKPRAGKSSVASALVSHLERGDPFLGLATTPTRTLLLSEECPTTLRERACRFGAPEAEVLFSSDAFGVSWASVVGRATEHCLQEGFGLLVVDTLNAWSGLRGDSENHAGAQFEAVEPLRRAAARGLAVLVLAHHRKSGGEYGDAIRGSSAVAGAVDVVIDFERSSGLRDNARELKALSRFQATPSALVLALEQDQYVVLGAPDAQQAEDERRRIRSSLSDGRTLTREQLEVDSGIPATTLQRRLREMEPEIVVSGAGKRGDPFRYALAPSGGGREEAA